VLKADGAPRRKGRAGRNSPASPVGVTNNGLYDSLRDWRKAEARTQGVPPYVIFHDQTLAEIARSRPANRDELLAVGGVGQAKLDRYGVTVLRLVAATAAA
jgi:ATP-dependent DNA helicase RecQ